jgi:hypothetical protein
MCGRATLTFVKQMELEDFLNAVDSGQLPSLLDSHGGYHNYNAPLHLYCRCATRVMMASVLSTRLIGGL